jgi:hypothetical protein
MTFTDKYARVRVQTSASTPSAVAHTAPMPVTQTTGQLGSISTVLRQRTARSMYTVA